VKAIFSPLVIGSLIAAVINQVLYFVATEGFGVQFVLRNVDAMEIPLFAPALFSVFQGIVGGVIVAWVATRTRSPKNTWLSISLIALALSFVLPFGGIKNFDGALWLNLMHVVAGALIIPMVRAALPASAATPE
jgi:zinc transporter ZupT